MTNIHSATEAPLDPRVEAFRSQPSENRDSSEQIRQAAREDAPAKEKKTASPAPTGPSLPAASNTAVTFRLNRETDRFLIEVVDRSTGEVVRQIPPEQLAKLAEQVGSLLNVSA